KRNHEVKPGLNQLKRQLENTTIEIDNATKFDLHGVTLIFEEIQISDKLEISTDRVAQLIVNGFGDADIIVFEDELQELLIDSETGEVTEFQQNSSNDA
ncbi:MAG: hypothetical protein GY765_14350, partial [bacterium]|nr:hypothetical protein [bacterium]